MRLELTSGNAATCFQDRVFIQPDAFRSSSSGGWSRTNGLLVQGQASLPAATAPDQSCCSDSARTVSVRGGRLERPSPGSKPGSLPLADPRISFTNQWTECPAGVEPALPAWKAGTFAARPRAQKAEGGRVELPRRQSLDRFRGGCHRPLACPSDSKSCGGRNRTCEGTLNRRLPVPAQAPPQ